MWRTGDGSFIATQEYFRCSSKGRNDRMVRQSKIAAARKDVRPLPAPVKRRSKTTGNDCNGHVLRTALLICDEPTTALDVTVQKTILELIKELQQEQNMGVIFITHDLGVVAEIADRVAIMYKGEIVEQGDTKQIFQQRTAFIYKSFDCLQASEHQKGSGCLL